MDVLSHNAMFWYAVCWHLEHTVVSFRVKWLTASHILHRASESHFTLQCFVTCWKVISAAPLGFLCLFWVNYNTPLRWLCCHSVFVSLVTSRQQPKTCKISGFHGGDYEECRLLGCKNSVRTSQETHYVSATEPSQIMLCKIWGSHSGEYEECRLLEFYVMWFL
jgi:hypothetical protein